MGLCMIMHGHKVFFCGKRNGNQIALFVLNNKNIMPGDGKGFRLCKKHVQTRLDVKKMIKLKKNVAQSFIT